MKPRADEAPTEVELEVARILCELPELVHKAESRRLPDFLRWGCRGRRSALDDGISLLDPPPPPPSISPPRHGNVERKDVSRGCGGGATSSPSTPLSFPASGGGATSSPSTPLSFPASGGEEPDGQPPRPPSSPPSKVFKKTKQHGKKKQSISEFDALHQKLKAKNTGLQSKMAAQQQQDGGSMLAPLGPITLQSLMDSDNQKIQPPPVDRNGGTPPPSVVAVGRWPVNRAALDLNASPPEEEEEEEWERSSAYKAAMSAQAKKRRPEIIQHEKNNTYSSSSSVSMAKKRG